MIYYLAQAYSNNPTQAYHDAVYWVNMLREKCKVAVFSPILHTHHYHLDSPEILAEFEDYVAWDLAILEAMCVEQPISNHFVDACLHATWCYEDIKKEWYQPKIVMLFAPTCFHNLLPMQEAVSKKPITLIGNWDSKGAQRAYAFAKDHHIRCLLLDPFLAGKEVEI